MKEEGDKPFHPDGGCSVRIGIDAGRDRCENTQLMKMRSFRNDDRD